MFWVVAGMLLFIIQVVAIILLEFRRPAKAVAWMVIALVLPVIGFIVYLFSAGRFVKTAMLRRMPSLKGTVNLMRAGIQAEAAAGEEDKKKLMVFSEAYQRLSMLVSRIPGSPMTVGNLAEVLTNGDVTFRSLITAMESAVDHIHVEFYILRDDELGQDFQQLWIRKAKEGVRVRVIYDGIGSLELKPSFLKRLIDGGVEVHCFSPPLAAFFEKRINYRNHRKIVVIDGRIGFLGGLNIGDEYLGKHERLGFWRDTHIRLEGPSVFDLQRVFLKDWATVCGQNLLNDSQLFPQLDFEGDSIVQIIASGPDLEREFILEVYFSAIAQAKSRIYITTPYFIPDSGLMIALKTAARSGVDVRIIIPGKPDYQFVHWATMSYAGELLEAGVRFFEYQRGFMHAKILIVDDVLASVGTANMDIRSLFSNYELNAFLYDRASILRVEQDFTEDLKDSIELKRESYAQRPRSQQRKEALARLLSPLL